MTRYTASLSPTDLAGYYESDPDPWRLATSEYERAKYEATLASLPQPRYAAALEVGCSIGILTRHLAGRCDTVLGLDVVPSAIETARANGADLPGARFAVCRVPAEWPDGTFDLLVFSEVLYFLDRTDLAGLVRRVEAALRPGGDIVLVHWLGETNFPQSADEAADGFISGVAGFARPIRQERRAEYRLDVLTRGL
jgi:SAM-dependent methyltransferase